MINEPMSSGPPSAVLAARIKSVRTGRGLTVQELARMCADLGASELTATMLYNIESGRPDSHGKRRRRVTVDELLTLATALEVAPVHLLVPLEDDAPYEITPGRRVAALVARDFVRGDSPLDGMDMRRFYSEAPEKEFDLKITHDRDGRTVERRHR